MPTSSTLWMAAGLLWILDASINISMEPFRAFIADKLNDEQRTSGFVMQSFFIGLGATFAGTLPLVFRYFGVEGTTTSGIPLTVKYSFQLGAVAFLAAVIWTVATTGEYPPEDLAAFERLKARAPRARGRRARDRLGGRGDAEDDAPARARAVLHVARPVLHVAVLRAGRRAARVRRRGPAVGALHEGRRVGELHVLDLLDRVLRGRVRRCRGSRRRPAGRPSHASALLCGSAGLLSVWFIHEPWLLVLSMCGIGIAWASILSMPYAIVAGALPPARMGVYMGVFNFFIVLPEILQALTFGPIIRGVFGANNPNSPIYVVLIGGVCLALCGAARHARGRTSHGG